MPLKVASELPRLKTPRPRTVLNPTGKISFVEGVFLFLGFQLLELEKSLLQKKLASVEKREKEIKDQLVQFAISLAKDFLTSI